MAGVSESDLENKYFNACCCCLKSGCFLDISSEYYSSGQKEVYGGMIKDTFNVQISTQDERKQLICEQCVSRLRDATIFKQMIADSQVVLRGHLESLKSYTNGIEDDPIIQIMENSEIKVEAYPLDGTEYHEGDSPMDNSDEIVSHLKDEITKPEHTSPQKKKTQNSHRKLKKCKIKKEADDTQSETNNKDWRKILERRGDGPILRENSLKLLAHCTGCVFQWNKSRYRCFCCKEPFSDLNSLREHTTSNHTLDHIERKIILQQNRLVKVEISTLSCKLCSEKANSLAEIRTHLTDKHKVEFVDKDDLLVPFKIDSQLQCQLCFEKFTVFRLLNIHMNKHYQKHVCHVCGNGFSNAVFLNLHKTRSHKPLVCKLCNLTFNSKSDKKYHDISVHGVKFERKLRFPCPYCNQRFFQENFRVKHLVEMHGLAKPEHKCDVCSKVFITKSLCNNHVKTVHMKEKNQECEVCHKLFYNKSDVLRHKVTHTGEKEFSCTVCSGLFATKDSLRRHLRRTHVGVQ